MITSTRKIGLLILMIIILPVLIFSVYEIGNLKQNERMIQDIYRNQLDAILFSINQYSDDVISRPAGLRTTRATMTLCSAAWTPIEYLGEGLIRFAQLSIPGLFQTLCRTVP
jgi:hypothetical protein